MIKENIYSIVLDLMHWAPENTIIHTGPAKINSLKVECSRRALNYEFAQNPRDSNLFALGLRVNCSLSMLSNGDALCEVSLLKLRSFFFLRLLDALYLHNKAKNSDVITVSFIAKHSQKVTIQETFFWDDFSFFEERDSFKKIGKRVLKDVLFLLSVNFALIELPNA